MHMLFILLLSYCASAHAEVYKCERTDHSVYYQDHDCNSHKEKQTRLLTDVSALPEETIDRLQQQYKQTVKEKKRKQRAAKNAAVKEKKRRVRKKAQCEKVDFEIAQVQEQYRRGYTTKRKQVLDKRLAEYKHKKLIACDNSES